MLQACSSSMNRLVQFHDRLASQAMACVLAGGRGSRLLELTDHHAKPAIFFGGKARIIDFALSNALNSGVRHLGVATQYQAHSLIRHLQQGWSFLRSERSESLDVLPAGRGAGKAHRYRGTADAIYQNLDVIGSYAPSYVIVLAGDHVYKMDFEPMLHQHVEAGADVTVGCIEVARSTASGFGVMAVDPANQITSFLEKPRDPPGIPGRPGQALASMGIYVFSTSFLVEQLARDAADPRSSRDFGIDLIPYIVKHGKAVAHRFERSCVKSAAAAEPYWRDVGTVDAYWQANIDLTSAAPAFDLDDPDWPIWAHTEVAPPARFVATDGGRRVVVMNSSISGGCLIAGASIERSLLFTGVRVEPNARLDGAVVLPHATVGRDCRLRNVVVDYGVRIPEGLVVGEHAGCDAQRFRRTEGGTCLITQAMVDRLAEVA
jgi:glucose-1-phosphate adenylyltransferase